MLTQLRRYACYKKPMHNKAEEELCVFVIELKALTVINVFKLGFGLPERDGTAGTTNTVSMRRCQEYMDVSGFNGGPGGVAGGGRRTE